MTQDVEAGACRDHGWQVAGVVRIDDADHGSQRAVRDAGLGVHLQQIEDRYAGRLAAGAGGGRNGDQRLEPTRYGLTPTNGRVDVGQEVCRIGRVQIGRLRRVDARPATDGDVAVEVALGRKADRFLE